MGKVNLGRRRSYPQHAGLVWRAGTPWVCVGVGEWWNRGQAPWEEYKKAFGFDLVGDVEPREGFKQGNGMTFIG